MSKNTNQKRETEQLSYRKVLLKKAQACDRMTQQEIMTLWGIDYKTFHKWMSPIEQIIGEKLGAYYTPKQVKIIVDTWDLPELQ